MPLFDEARAARRRPATPRRALSAACRVLIKDLLATVAGAPYAGGLRVLKDAGFRRPHDSLPGRRACARPASSSSARPTRSELGIVPTTEPVAWGPTRNPWNPGHSTGGSSGGSAAAVAAGLVAGRRTPTTAAARSASRRRAAAWSASSRAAAAPRSAPTSATSWAASSTRASVTRSVRDTAAFLDVDRRRRARRSYAAPPPSRPYLAEVGAAVERLRVGFCTRYVSPTGQLDRRPPRLRRRRRHDRRTSSPTSATPSRSASCRRSQRPEYVARFLAVWSAGVTVGPRRPRARRPPQARRRRRRAAHLGPRPDGPLGHRAGLPRRLALVATDRARRRRGLGPHGRLAHADDHHAAAAPRLLRQPALQPARRHLQGRRGRALHRALQRHRPARDLAADPRHRPPISPSASSSPAPTAARTSCSASPSQLEAAHPFEHRATRRDHAHHAGCHTGPPPSSQVMAAAAIMPNMRRLLSSPAVAANLARRPPRCAHALAGAGAGHADLGEHAGQRHADEATVDAVAGATDQRRGATAAHEAEHGIER